MVEAGLRRVLKWILLFIWFFSKCTFYLYIIVFNIYMIRMQLISYPCCLWNKDRLDTIPKKFPFLLGRNSNGIWPVFKNTYISECPVLLDLQ